MNQPKTTAAHEVPVIHNLIVDACEPGTISKFWLHVVTDGLSRPVQIPVMVAKGLNSGPVLGLTAAVHGNELNGIPVIQRLFNEIDIKNLAGTIVGVPVVNAPSLLRRRRRFIDGTDLNHIMPGKPNGNVSEVYAYRLIDRVINQFDYLLDLHTASFGRVNSYYIRADMNDKTTAQLAWLQNAQIIVNNAPNDGTLRGAASNLNIPAITLEVGDPNKFQKGMIRSGMTGIYNVLSHLKMIPGEIDRPAQKAVLCHASYWIYTDTGGLLDVLPKIAEFIKRGDIIAVQRNIFGEVTRKYICPEDGIVIGKSVNPISQTGARILHLGVKFD